MIARVAAAIAAAVVLALLFAAGCTNPVILGSLPDGGADMSRLRFDAFFVDLATRDAFDGGGSGDLGDGFDGGVLVDLAQ